MTGENENQGPVVKTVAELELELLASRTQLESERKMHALEVENLRLKESLARTESSTPILDKILAGADRYLDMLTEVEARAAEQEQRERPPQPEPPAPEQ